MAQTTPSSPLAEEREAAAYTLRSATMPANGAGDWLQSRKSTKFGRVLELAERR